MLHEDLSSSSETFSPLRRVNREPVNQLDDYYESEEEEYYKESQVQEMPLFQRESSSPLRKIVKQLSGQTSTVCDALDLVERGMAKYRWHAEYLKPPLNDSMKYCQMHKFKNKKNEFLMFLEYEKQLPLIKLYARRQGNEWLIHSLDPTDPNYKEEDYLFRLVMDKTNYILWSTTCELCDLKYKKRCMSTVAHRQQLLIGQNYTRSYHGAGLNLYRAYIPSIVAPLNKSCEIRTVDSASTENSIKKSRVYCDSDTQRRVWCPFTLPGQLQSSHVVKPNFSFKQISLQTIDNKEVPEDSVFIHSKLPEWSSKDRCWVMNSYGRIRQASKRNMQLCTNFQSDQLIFQMGKLKKGVYILDYKRPLCFVQAMAIGLATNEWKSSL